MSLPNPPYPEYNNRVPVSPTELRPFSKDEWLINLTIECKKRIEAVERGERVKSIFLRSGPDTGKSTWACMLDYWRTWYNYRFMNVDVWKPGDKVFIAHNMSSEVFWDFKSYFKGERETNFESSTRHIVNVKGPWLFIFISQKNINELGWNDRHEKDVFGSYVTCVDVGNIKFYN